MQHKKSPRNITKIFKVQQIAIDQNNNNFNNYNNSSSSSNNLRLTSEIYKIKQTVLTFYLRQQQPSNTIPHVFVVDWNNKVARAQVFSDQRTQNDSDPISQYWNTDLSDYCHRASAPLRELLSEWDSKILIIEYFSMHRILPTTEKSFLDTEEYKVPISTIIK